MYSTCIFCNKSLGSNESLEAFPVGERLAFDAARGRLWVVCRSCERWNLTPLDERWEAIEQAERLFRDARQRLSTDNIGLARLASGLTLVRIGEPQRPEFAAWRYGDQFGRRRRRALLWAGGGVAAVGALFVGGSAAGIGMGGFAWMFTQFGKYVVHGNPETVVATVRHERQGVMQVRRRHLAESRFFTGSDGALGLYLRYKNGAGEFTGAEAERIASVVLPIVNRFGGKAQEVQEAVRHIEATGNTERFLRTAAEPSFALVRNTPSETLMRRRRAQQRDFHRQGLFKLPAAQRLALEMALHEEAERRALEGELADLEKAWRDAEEVAGIADNLFVPSSVDEQFRRLKGDGPDDARG